MTAEEARKLMPENTQSIHDVYSGIKLAALKGLDSFTTDFKIRSDVKNKLVEDGFRIIETSDSSGFLSTSIEW